MKSILDDRKLFAKLLQPSFETPDLKRKSHIMKFLQVRLSSTSYTDPINKYFFFIIASDIAENTHEICNIT